MITCNDSADVRAFWYVFFYLHRNVKNMHARFLMMQSTFFWMQQLK